MAKIYQTFCLDEVAQKEEDERIQKEKKKKGKDAPGIVKQRGEILIQSLKAKGYDIFVSGESYYAGISTSIIVGAEISRMSKIKADFGDIANVLGLQFISGPWYREVS